jgi:exodeoxyribonuclease VII small subunit
MAQAKAAGGGTETPIEKLKFEEAMKRLEAIVAAMESGQIEIEDAVSRYEEAMKLKTHCQRILDQAEQRIRKIQLDAAGEPGSEPFDLANPTGRPANGSSL